MELLFASLTFVGMVYMPMDFPFASLAVVDVVWRGRRCCEWVTAEAWEVAEVRGSILVGLVSFCCEPLGNITTCLCEPISTQAIAIGESLV